MLKQAPLVVRSAEESIRRALDLPSDVEFIETPLKECLLFLKEQHNINLALDEQKVADEGVATDTLINLQVTGPSLRSILDNILRNLRLDHFMANEFLIVTTAVDTSRRLETHVYDVRALVKAKFTQDLLRDTLTHTLAVSSWSGTGGAGVIESLPGCLVIRQSVAVHRQINNLLRRLARQGRAVFGGPHWSLTPAEKAEIVMNRVLDKQIALELTNTRLDQIVGLLATPGMPIVLDFNALKKERIEPRQMVNLKVEGQPLAKVLDLVLEPLKLDWTVEDEVVLVTTRRQMDELLPNQMRTYDILDLLNRTTGTTWTAAKLVETVTARVNPDSWDDVGGWGTIREIRGILVITQTPRNQRKIAELLAELRKVPR